MNNYLYILLHVHKCAGSTIRHHIINSLEKDEYIIFRKSVDARFEDQNHIEEFLSSQSNDQLKKVKFISGHGAYYGIHKFFPDKIPRYLVILRDPFDRTVSNYNYFIQTIEGGYSSRESIIGSDGNLLDFETWLKNTTTMQNYILRFLRLRILGTNISENLTVVDLEMIKDKLNGFYFVGISEEEDDIQFIYGLLKVNNFYENRNISERYYEPMESDRNKFRKYLELDYDLYSYVKDLSVKLKSDVITDFYDVVNTAKKLRKKKMLLKNIY